MKGKLGVYSTENGVQVFALLPLRQEWATYGPVDRTWPASNSCVARQAPKGKEIILMNIMRILARVACAACYKNHNVFAACCGKKVAHHCSKTFFSLPYLTVLKSPQFRMFQFLKTVLT